MRLVSLSGVLLFSMYILIKYLQTYMAPSLSIFGDFTKDASAMYNNFRVYGTGLLVVMGTIVFIGVKFVNKFATVALACVLFSILAVYVGIFVNFNGNDNLQLVLSLLHVLCINLRNNTRRHVKGLKTN